ncbi:hypothetical protein C789_416 [Microcystis aeruginosa FACHB-905 = DIANCHI905]|nr:hypothetical protein C789_416 [Microcystis aeruginosa FACHB-905 = DIANCHI905]
MRQPNLQAMRSHYKIGDHTSLLVLVADRKLGKTFQRLTGLRSGR